MPGLSRNERVQKLRANRRERGERETNVWLSQDVGTAIEEEVQKGRFKSRQEAIAKALEAVFVRKEQNVVN
ncbi:hypothetical protein P7L87_25975 [Vibrio parahaemolyticus]|nr:hypothetical protein [Vibrio parahaemolyticus]